jgi:uncharacterized membrane protein YqjE
VAKQIDAPGNVSWSTLLNGIVSDLTRLFGQELELAKLEIREDIRNAKALVTSLILGLLVTGMGVLMLIVMVALALATYTIIPMWGCFGIVGGVMCLMGAGLLLWVKGKKTDIDFIPQRATEAVKEDIGWISSSIRTSKSENGHARL